MATKQMFAARDFRYGTRMLRAGEPVEMDASHQRLYTALGAVTADRPKPAKPIIGESPIATAARAVDAAKPKPAAKKATRKKATKKPA